MLVAYLLVLGSAVGATVWARWKRAMVLAGVLKVACSLGFVGLAVARGFSDSHYAGWMFAGLGLSAAGDAILLVRRKPALVVGAIGFAFAHVAYLVAWGRLLRFDAWVFAAGVALAALVGWVAYATRARTGRLRWLVLVYGWVLGASVVCAVAVGIQAGGLLGWSLGLGGGLFLVSDLSVLRDRLLTPSLWNPTWGLPCYYAAQVCFALSVAQVHTVPI